MYSIFNSGFLCFSANDLESELKKLRCNTAKGIILDTTTYPLHQRLPCFKT